MCVCACARAYMHTTSTHPQYVTHRHSLTARQSIPTVQQMSLIRKSHLKDSGQSSTNNKEFSSTAGTHVILCLCSAARQIIPPKSTGIASNGFQTKQTQSTQVTVCSPMVSTITQLVEGPNQHLHRCSILAEYSYCSDNIRRFYFEVSGGGDIWDLRMYRETVHYTSSFSTSIFGIENHQKCLPTLSTDNQIKVSKDNDRQYQGAVSPHFSVPKQ